VASTFSDLFAGGGEMGARMQALDWSKTAVGPLEGWPHSLKTIVRIMLTSRYAMWMGWGRDLTFFCNDAYRPTLGVKHEWALGASARRVWAEIWTDIGPRAEAVLDGGGATWDEGLLLFLRRRGFPEETYHTFSYSPVPDDAGGIGGMLCVVTEDTKRTIGERRLRTLREIAAATGAGRTAAETCQRAVQSLAGNPRDLPFVLLYLTDQPGGPARLAGQAHLTVGSPAGPATVPLIAPDQADPTAAAPSPSWPFAEVAASRAALVMNDVSHRFGPVVSGPWPEPIETAMVLPLTAPGHGEPLIGFFVAGTSPRRPFDDDYRGFLELLAGQLIRAVGDARAYEEERSRAERLAELDRAKTAFFSNVSHEFRTPLTLILGPVEDALARAAPELGGEALASVYRNTVRLYKLVNSMLDFARIEAGRVDAAYQPTDLARLTTDLASVFRAAIERAGLRFTVDCPALPEPVYVDRDMWEKIVLNLLSNALKFTFEGAIEVALHPRDGQVELEVRDSGTGIPPAELPHVFTRFHRVQGGRARTHEGSGIGLALVEELVRLHGGVVRVESRLGVGTTFSVCIPRGLAHLRPDRLGADRAPAAGMLGAAPFVEEALRWLPAGPPRAAAEAAALSSPPAVAAPDRRALILLADDNADMREYLSRLLNERWRVEAVGDGAAALAAARALHPSLVLTDVMMPVLDGFGLLGALRADVETHDIPVIMLSARAGEESRVEGLQAGADDYLVKPFSARELVARVSTHLEIGRLRAAAQEGQRRLYRLFMQAPVAVAVFVEPEHRFEVANAPYCEMVGRSPLVGKTVREAFPELGGQHEVIATLDRVYRSGEPMRVTELNVPLRRAGAEVPADAFFNYVLQPLTDERGEVAGIMVVATEVTEQVQARQRMDALRQEAEQANRTKDEFLAMLGHELRNPLAPIFTALELMRLRADGDGSAQRERIVIERQVNHLARLVDDLLDVSRITSGKVQLKRQPIELAEVVGKAIEVASPILEQRQHDLIVQVPAHGLMIDGDATRLSQVVANLLTNAAKYTDPRGHIQVRAERVEQEAVLTVRDDGIGIAPAILPHIFRTFVQERQAADRAQGGLGLGLAIVRSLITLHGGSVSGQSEGTGRGSEFTVRLPIARPSAAAEPPVQEGVAVAGRSAAPAGAPAQRILVVDDNADAAVLLAEALELLGHELRIAHDGPSALLILENYLPAVAFVDIGLPVMDGYELGRRLRADPRLAGMRLVAVTGYGQESDRRRSAEAGFDEHLVKPVFLDRLEKILASAPSAPAAGTARPRAAG
jgi:PAS domain S-box-containing protein